MPNLYRQESSDPKNNAQRNLLGRSHYVDDDTLRFHKSRVLSARHVDGGLLFAIVTSDALDMSNTKRGFRYVIFDIFGYVISRVDLETAFKSRDAATKAMWKVLNATDARAITLEAVEREEVSHTREMAELRSRIAELSAAA